MSNESNLEIEVRFLEIDKAVLASRLNELGAEDLGEELLSEIIFYDKELTRPKEAGKVVRIRKSKNNVFLTYKHQKEASATGTEEIEFSIGDMEKAKQFLEKLGLLAYRHQEKRRHTFILDSVTVDIDQWPQIPALVELEGESETALRAAALKLNLDWNNAVFDAPTTVITDHYNIPVKQMRYFTFNKIEMA